MPRVPPESPTSVQAAPRFSARRTGAPSGTAALLTDFWQLLAAQHTYDTVAADAALQNSRAFRTAFYFSDTHRTFGDRNLFRTSKRSTKLRVRNEDCEASFIRDIQEIEPENFAGAWYRLLHGNQSFFQLDADVSVGRDLVQRRGSEASSRHFGGHDSTHCPHPLHSSMAMAILPPAAPVTF